MEKIKQLLKKKPSMPLGIVGALLFLLLFYVLAFRTPLWQAWMPPNMDNDEVIYNRQVVSVISHGGPLGYFGYDESHADIGRYGAWGPILIWVYGLAGHLFGASVNTVYWCNVLFLAAGIVFFTVAARLTVGKQILCYGGLVCLWMPLAGAFCGSSEALHYMLALVIIASAAALIRGGGEKPAGGYCPQCLLVGWKRSSAPTRCCSGRFRWQQYGLIKSAVRSAWAGQRSALALRCSP